MIVRSSDVLYPTLLAKFQSSKGHRFDVDGQLWQSYDEHGDLFFVSIDRGTPDRYDKKGKWDRYYGPNNVQSEK